MNVYAGLVLIFVFASFFITANEKPKPLKSQEEMQLPEDVKGVIDNKCFGCHNSDSKNDKAKEKLDFKTFNELPMVKKIGAFNHISEVLEKNEMPPEKFLARFPDKKLTDEETKILTEWVKKETSSLMGN